MNPKNLQKFSKYLPVVTHQHVLLFSGREGRLDGGCIPTSCSSCVRVSTQTACLKLILLQCSSCDTDSLYLYFTFYGRTLDTVAHHRKPRGHMLQAPLWTETFRQPQSSDGNTCCVQCVCITFIILNVYIRTKNT